MLTLAYFSPSRLIIESAYYKFKFTDTVTVEFNSNNGNLLINQVLSNSLKINLGSFDSKRSQNFNKQYSESAPYIVNFDLPEYIFQKDLTILISFSIKGGVDDYLNIYLNGLPLKLRHGGFWSLCASKYPNDSTCGNWDVYASPILDLSSFHIPLSSLKSGNNKFEFIAVSEGGFNHLKIDQGVLIISYKTKY